MKKLLFIFNSMLLIAVLYLQYIAHLESSGMDEEVLGYISLAILGVVQLCTALCFFIKWKKHHVFIRKSLLVYWGIVLVYAVIGCSYLSTNSFNKDERMLLLTTPLGIAVYLVFVIYLKSNYKTMRA